MSRRKQTIDIEKKLKTFKKIDSKNSRTDNSSKVADADLLSGRVEGHKDGFAFFIPDDGNLKDVFIHERNLNGARDKDKVLVYIQKYRGRDEAIVNKVVERGLDKVVGIYDRDRGQDYLIPLSKTFKQNIVLDCGGKKYKDNDVILASINETDKNKVIHGKVLEHIGNLEDKGIDNKIVILKNNIRTRFSKEILDEAKQLVAKPIVKDKKIKDFRKLFTSTIDGESAKDFDDAISIEKGFRGYSLYVHIADVSHYVRRGSAIDDEAILRGTSIYFPEFAIPMLPEDISNNVCSLMPNVDRFSVTVKIDFDKAGNIRGKEFYRSIINSDYRLTYRFVNEVLAGKESVSDKKLKKFITELNELYNILDKKKQSEDYISFDLPEPIFIFDKDGNLVDIQPSERGISERAIEYFMISANEAVAKFLADSKTPSIYRVHDKPDIMKVQAWAELANSFGLKRIELVDNVDAKLISEYAKLALTSKNASILLSTLVRSMMRAEYTVDNIGHFGLSSAFYTHFTSPIRRYPDLLVHRALLHKLGYEDSSENIDELTMLAKKMTSLEKVSFDAENDIGYFKKLSYLTNNHDEIYKAYVNKINQYAIGIYIEKLMLVGTIEFSDIKYDTFRVENGVAVSTRYNKQYKLGDNIEVKLLDTDIYSFTAFFKFANDIDEFHTAKKDAKKFKKVDTKMGNNGENKANGNTPNLDRSDKKKFNKNKSEKISTPAKENLHIKKSLSDNKKRPDKNK